MATDNKYNDRLLELWYTQDQIDAMTGAVSSGQNAMDVVKNMNSSMGNTQSPAATQAQTSSTPSSTPTSTPTVKQETVTTQPETPVTTVPEIQQQGALKPLSQDYYNQTSDTALNTIKDNLNRYKQTNPEYFTDYDSFKRNFSYDTRNDEQKNVLDTWYKWYQQSLQLSTVPTTDLYTQYQAGQVSAADLESLRISNPEKYAELQTQINRWNIVSAYDDNKGTTTEDMFEQIKTTWLQNTINNLTTAGSGASSIFDSYEEKMNSPEMLELSDQSAELQEQMENLTTDIDSIKKTVEAEYAGTGASRAKINAIISDRTYDLQLQLRTLNSEYNKYATQYNNRMQQYQTEFNMELQEYQLNMQERNQKMNELGFAMDLMSFETPEQAQEREWNYRVKQQEYANGDINSKDYSSRYKAALNSVQNLLSQYSGIPMQRSAEQMAEDILKGMDANGTSLGEELTKINKQIQQKPEYKMLYNQTYGYSTWASWLGKIQTIWGREYVEYNGKLYTSDEFNSMFGGTNGTSVTTGWVEYTPVNPYQLQGALADWINGNKNGTKWGQCGKFVNDYLQTLGLGRLYGNSIASKTATINVDSKDIGNLSVWSVAVFDYSNVAWVSENAKKYWHVGIVSDIDLAQGRVKLIESNLRGDEKVVSTRWVDINSPALKWYFDPSKWAVVAGTTTVATNGDTGFVSWSIEGVPLAYERAVKNLVPSTLQNSDAEREALNTIITNAYKWGVDQSQIALKFMWFDIKNEEDQNLALDLVNTIRTLSTETQEWIVQTISDLMNQWSYTKAIQTVENAVSQQAKNAWNYVSELSVKNTISKSNDLMSTISGLKKSPVWVVEWTMETWLWKYASKDAKNIQSKISLLEQWLDIKDKEAAQRILPQLTDTPATFMTKLENLWNNAMVELNWWRTIYWLPELTLSALNDYAQRVNLYRNPQAATTSWKYSIADTNFYQKYANTAAWAGSVIQTSYGTFYW